MHSSRLLRLSRGFRPEARSIIERENGTRRQKRTEPVTIVRSIIKEVLPGTDRGIHCECDETGLVRVDPTCGDFERTLRCLGTAIAEKIRGGIR